MQTKTIVSLLALTWYINPKRQNWNRLVTIRLTGIWQMFRCWSARSVEVLWVHLVIFFLEPYILILLQLSVASDPQTIKQARENEYVRRTSMWYKIHLHNWKGRKFSDLDYNKRQQLYGMVKIRMTNIGTKFSEFSTKWIKNKINEVNKYYFKCFNFSSVIWKNQRLMRSRFFFILHPTINKIADSKY